MSTEYKSTYPCDDCAWGHDIRNGEGYKGFVCSFLEIIYSLRARGLKFDAPAVISHCPEWRPQ